MGAWSSGNSTWRLEMTEISEEDRARVSQVLEAYCSLTDEFLVTGGNTVYLCIDKLRAMGVDYQTEFNLIMSLNDILLKNSVEAVRDDPYGLVETNVPLRSYRFFSDAPDDVIEETYSILGALLEIIAYTLMGYELYVFKETRSGSCFRIKRYDSFSLTLIKYVPWM